MGKALVIKGLDVVNPISNVSFNDAEDILSKYLEANETINTTEKDALVAFVSGMIDAGLWDKVKYFYPLLGTTVTDLLLEAVDIEHEDIFANAGTTGLSANNRLLVSKGRNQSRTTLGSRSVALDLSKIGFVVAGFSEETIAAGQGFVFIDNNAAILGLNVITGSSNNRYVDFKVHDWVHSTSAYYEVLKRITFGTVVNGTGYVYDKNTQLATDTVDTTNISLVNNYGALWSNEATKDYNFTFLMITEGITAAEWEDTMYQLVHDYLVAVGKYSDN